MRGITLKFPTVTSFLLVFSLKFGAIVTCLWTLLRSALFATFIVLMSVKIFPMDSPPSFLVSFTSIKPEPTTVDNFQSVFLVYVSLFLCEVMLFMFTINFLAIGLYLVKASRVRKYILSRFFTWIVEVIGLLILSVKHHSFNICYLPILVIICTELYGYMTVYSYFKKIQPTPEPRRPIGKSMNKLTI